ncbi:hypothetical protein HLRTI_002154 [Halorhabdus tiamatea SARL4B]|uniref:Pycsar effector protein domain-containing protein n=1 Tax=Halorhabdus tiamatea SARL4B TaxID=1033806 RepID=U2E179_9EURY|nr:hypothetical protein [Halorhabdus tiamatea]ERJ05766.1 hypothetical protein HLRTI_002154 [Halorhabdus tiamatea SARL4B]
MTGNDSPENDGLEPHLHLAEKYDRMVESQLRALTNIDTNAWRAARLIGIILGILLTGFSIVAQGKGNDVTLSPAVIFFLTIGVVSLLVSLVFAAVSILNVKVGYGPGTHLSDGLTEGDVSRESYPGIVSKNLAKNIKKNNRVLSSKADKLRYTYNFLIVGLVSFSTSVGLLVTTPSRESALVIGIGSVLVMLGISYYILYKKYDNEAEKGDSDTQES